MDRCCLYFKYLKKQCKSALEKWHTAPPQACLQISLALCLMQVINHLFMSKWFRIKALGQNSVLFALADLDSEQNITKLRAGVGLEFSLLWFFSTQDMITLLPGSRSMLRTGISARAGSSQHRWCQHNDADLTPVCPTAENGICRVTQANPEGLPNPTACSTEIQKIPPMVHYFGKDLRLGDEVSLLHFKIAGRGQRGTNAAAVVNILATASFFAFVLLW
ncbi:hypothetical protein Q9966_006620 [Columba livia]|nr:hypothetical protein Q9966_006620 [Columba livia]